MLWYCQASSTFFRWYSTILSKWTCFGKVRLHLREADRWEQKQKRCSCLDCSTWISSFGLAQQKWFDCKVPCLWCFDPWLDHQKYFEVFWLEGSQRIETWTSWSWRLAWFSPQYVCFFRSIRNCCYRIHTKAYANFRDLDVCSQLSFILWRGGHVHCRRRLLYPLFYLNFTLLWPNKE